MEYQTFTFLVFILNGMGLWPTLAYDIFKGQEFLFNVPDKQAPTCTFTVHIVKSNPQEGYLIAILTEKSGGSNGNQVNVLLDMIEIRLISAASNPMVNVTTTLKSTVTLQVTCEADNPPKLATTQLIPTASWGRAYTIVFPGPMEITCATVSLLSKVTTHIALFLTGKHKTTNVSGTQVVTLEDGSACSSDGPYTLYVTAEERYQLTAHHWDMTGSTLESSEPFSVTYWPKNADVSPYTCRSSSLMMEQIVPNKYWGLTYGIPQNVRFSTIIRIVALHRDTSVSFNIGNPKQEVLLYPGDSLQYSLESEDIVESNKPIMVLATFYSSSPGGAVRTSSFTQVTPFSHTQADVSLVYVANLYSTVLMVVNSSCGVEPVIISSANANFFDDLVVQNMYMFQYLDAEPLSGNILERLSLTAVHAQGCYGGITGMVLIEPLSTNGVLAARPLSFSSCPLGMDYSDTSGDCQFSEEEEELTTSPPTTETLPSTTEVAVTTVGPEKTSTIETSMESTTEPVTTPTTSSPDAVVTTSIATSAAATITTATAATTTAVATTTQASRRGRNGGRRETSVHEGQSSVTTESQKPFNAIGFSSNKTLQCPCSCSFSRFSVEDQLMLSKKRMKQILHQLLVKKDALLQSKLKLECAKDWRSSSVTIGTSGIAFLICTFGLILCADLCFLPRSRPRLCAR